jgi:hypothetical protein
MAAPSEQLGFSSSLKSQGSQPLLSSERNLIRHQCGGIPHSRKRLNSMV